MASAMQIDGSDYEDPMNVDQDNPRSRDREFVRKADVDKLWNFLLYGCPRTVHIPQNDTLEDESARIIERLIVLGGGGTVIDAIRKAAIGNSGKDDGNHAFDDSPATCLKYPLLYALAVCIKSNNPATKQKAYDCLVEVCTIPSYLFLFLNLYYRMLQRSEHHSKPSWPRSFRKAIKKWYTQFEPLRLAYLVTKYRSRYGWNHKKVLRLAHIGHDRVGGAQRGFVIKYLLSGIVGAKGAYPQQHEVSDVREYLEAVEYVRTFDYRKEDSSLRVETLLEKIKTFELMWEHVQTYVLKSPLIWKTLLSTMPPLALIRNLSRLSYLGLLTPGSEEEKVVCERLQKEDTLHQARIHPLTILIAISKYTTGQNQRNKRWPVNQSVLSCLQRAFCKSYGVVSSTGKKLLLALNVNTTMLCPVVASPALSSKMAAVAIAKIFFEADRVAQPNNQRVHCIKFDSNCEPVNMEPDVNVISETFPSVEGQPDFTAPFRYATNLNLQCDAFVILSDFVNDDQVDIMKTGLSAYCNSVDGRAIKLVIIALSSTELSEINPEEEENILAVPGVDINSLKKVRDFIECGSDFQNSLSQMLESLNILTR